MHFVDFELSELSQQCHNVIPHSKLVACHPTVVRVDIRHSVARQLSASFRFPADYPHRQPVLVELQSKTLCPRLLDGLTQLCDQRAKAILGRAQIIEVLKCIHSYLTEHPLCVVFAEVANIRHRLDNGSSNNNNNNGSANVACGGGGGELKLRQKQNQLVLVARGGPYEFRVKVHVPADYPQSCVRCAHR